MNNATYTNSAQISCAPV